MHPEEILAIIRALRESDIVRLRATVDQDTRQEIIMDGIIISSKGESEMTKLACSTCGKESDISVPGCGLWLCPFDGAVNKIEGDQGEGESWLACLPFQGEERFLPVGYQIRSPGLFVLDFVAAYIVLNHGQVVTINPWEAGSGVPGKILGVVLNELAVQTIQATYGGRGIVIEDANGRRLTVPEWRAEFGTDPLAQLAISRAYLATTGPGVQTYRPAGTKFGVDATKITGAGQGRTHTGRPVVKLGKYADPGS